MVLSKNAEELSELWLADAEVLSIAGGLFVLAGEIRQICVSKYKNQFENGKKGRYFNVRKLCAIYLSAGEPEMALEVLNRTGKIWRKVHKETYDRLSGLITGSMSGFLPPDEPESEGDKVFREMISGKNVALLGPASGHFSADEIKRDFDVKIRTTFRGMETLNGEQQECGVDVSYYGQLGSNILSEDNEMHFFDELKMAVFKNIVHDFQENLLNEGRGREKLGTASYFMFQGSSNMAQIILLDLFHFSPKRIKLFNINLFLSSKRWQSGYNITGAPQVREAMWRSLAIHNLISQYEVTKLWYEAGLFEADEELTEVLSLGADEYLRQMELLEE